MLAVFLLFPVAVAVAVAVAARSQQYHQNIYLLTY